MTKRIKRIVAFLSAVALSVSTILGASIMNGAKAADSEPTPVTLEGFETITIEDFVDEKGNPMPAGEYKGASTGAHNVFYADGLTNLDKKLLTMKITYGGGDYKHSLIFGGNGGWCGFNLRPNGDGSTLFVDSSWAGSIVNKSTYSAPYLTAEAAGLTSFINNEFLLQMSFEYGEADANNKADLKLGIYINGKLYQDQEFVIPACDMNNVGNVLALYREVDGSSIIVDSIDAKEIKPVELEGFKTLTVEDFSDSTGKQMESGEYEGDPSGAHNVFYAKDVANFDKTLVSMKITYGGGEYKHSLIIGGTHGWQGFNLRPTSDGSSLIVDKTWGGDITSSTTPTLSAGVAGLTSFINNEFLLQMSFEYGEADANNKADLTLGIYINGKLYNDEKFTIADCSLGATGNVMALYREVKGSSIIVKSIKDNKDEPEEPGQPTEFTDITIKDFVDDSGAQAQEKAYGNAATNGTLDFFHLKNQTSFDKMRLSMKVKFEGGGGNTRIDVGGKSAWTGLSIFATEEGNHLYVYDNYGMTNPKCIIEMNKETAGVSSFLNQEFLLQLTFEFDKSNNLKLGIYINEKLYNDQVFTVAGCDMSKFGSYIGLYREKMNSVITVASYPEQVVEKPNENLTKVSFSDLGVRNKVYDAVGGDLAVKGDYGQTLAGTIVGGDIQLDGTGLFQIVFGGKTNGWDGLRMMATDSYIHTYWYAGSEGTFIKTLVPNVAGVDFVGEKYKLEVSLEVVGNDIKVGYWFNGILYENAYETIPNRAEELGGLFGVYCAEADDKVTIGTPSDEDDDQEEDVTPEKPNSNWSKYTWKDFEIKEKTYKFNGDLIASGKLTAKDTLASSIFGGDIQLNGGDGFQVIAGGKDLGWDGLRLIANSGRFDVYWYKGNTGTFVESLYSDKAGVSFLNEKYNLKISMEVVGKNLKVGIWFNDVLYNNKYFEILNKAEQLGNRFGVYAPAAENTVVIGNPVPGEDDDTPKQPNPKFEKLTFGHFAVKDMTYPYNGDMVVQGSVDDRTTLDKTVICGDVLLSGKGSFQLIFGGNGNAWDGLRLIADEKAMHVYWYKGSEGTYVKSLMPLAAGTEFVGQEMNLMVSMEKSGKDVKVGIWINGVLYENEYIIFKGKAKELGNMFAAYCSDPSATITLNSIAEIAPEPEKPKKPNKDFKKLTFSHFEVKDGKHKCDGTVAATLQGKTEYSLDGAILCGDIRIEGVGNTYLMYGGLNNVWYGFRFSVLSNGNIALYWIDEDGMYLIETFDATTAGTKLVDEWFNVMISTEVVDADDDGEEDDIEFGIWFNEVLYKNKYLTVLNEAKDFGKWFGIDCATEGTAVSTKSIPELIEGFNYALYGFTENWEEEILRTGFKAGMAVGGSKDAAAFTGDLLENGKVFFWVFGAVSALVAGIYLALQGKKKKI